MLLRGFIYFLTTATLLGALPTPPLTESKPRLLDSYLPACMQTIAHYSELMKYDIRPKPPQSDTLVTSTTTIRPTPHHKPGYYAPVLPPGAQAYYARTNPYDEYLQRFRNPQGFGYIGGGYVRPGQRDPITGEAGGVGGFFQGGKLPKDLDLFGITTSDLLHRVNRIDDYDFDDDDDKLERFAVNYDDVRVNLQLLRSQKRVPPTRAYVTLLSLYDALNKEAKNQNFQNYSGYTEKIVKELAATSSGSASDQLKFVVTSYRPQADRRNPEVIKKLDALIADLEKPDSYIHDALRDMPPLQFLP